MKTFTKKIITERQSAPTTPYWQSIIRKCERVKSAFMISGASLIGIKLALLAVTSELPIVGHVMTVPAQIETLISYIVYAGWVIAIVGYLIGWVAKFIASLTVADPKQLNHS